jgi:nucleoid-associated protein YgaU
MPEPTASGSAGILGWVLGAGLAVGGVAGGLYVSGRLAPELPDAPVETQAAARPIPQDSAVATVMPDGTDAPDSDAAPDADRLAAPRFDIVRIDPDGSALVAGAAPVGSAVTVLIDDQPVGQAEVDESGTFVLFLTVVLGDAPRVLTLAAERDGERAVSDDQMILAALPAQTDPVAETTPPEPQVLSAALDDTPATRPADMNANPPPEDRNAPAEATVAALDDAPGQGGFSAETAEEPLFAQDAPIEAGAPALALRADAPAGAGTVAQAPAVAVLRAGREGVDLVQPIRPQDPAAADRIALDTIGYTEAGDVRLSGRAGAGRVVRVYVDNDAVADLATDADGAWAGHLDGVDPGVYTLRLDELDEDGTVVSRVETPFQRESPERLVSPVADASAETTPVARAITVQAGDTLWAISQSRYGEGMLYLRVVEANDEIIRDPDLIYPGQVFKLPE